MLPRNISTLTQFYSRPSRWTKGVTARDAHGNPTESESPHAVSLCLSAAVYHVYGEESIAEITEKLLAVINAELSEEDSYSELSDWNDSESRTFKDLRSLIVKANL